MIIREPQYATRYKSPRASSKWPVRDVVISSGTPVTRGHSRTHPIDQIPVKVDTYVSEAALTRAHWGRIVV
jgi:hypothetical protein